MSKPKIVYRRAAAADAARLLPMVEIFYAGDEYQTPREALSGHLTRMLAEPSSAIFLAEDGAGEAQGFCAALMGVGLEFGLTAQIESLYVAPKLRGKRVGSRLMASALQWCEGQGAGEVVAVIGPRGEPGRQLERLFLRLGFKQGQRRVMYRAFKDNIGSA